MAVNSNILVKGTVSGAVSKAKSVIVKEVEFGNKAEFPSRGYHKYIYVALDENKLYRWDDEQGYVILGSEIDDGKTSSLSTWSSRKINTEINSVSDILDYATDEDIRNLF